MLVSDVILKQLNICCLQAYVAVLLVVSSDVIALMGRFDAIIGNFRIVTEGQKFPVTRKTSISLPSSSSRIIYFLKIRAPTDGHNEFLNVVVEDSNRCVQNIIERLPNSAYLHV